MADPHEEEAWARLWQESYRIDDEPTDLIPFGNHSIDNKSEVLTAMRGECTDHVFEHDQLRLPTASHHPTHQLPKRFKSAAPTALESGPAARKR
ncbi:MAG TPA: hypothetical protein VKG25_06530 [Bryobacteraceae bacterium]|nr:hypothetical protein [Bryobacteraceae bacterium]